LKYCSALAQESQDFSVTEKKIQAVGSQQTPLGNKLEPQLVQIDAANDPMLFRSALDLYETTFTDDCELSREELEDSLNIGKHYLLALPDGTTSIKGFAIIGSLNTNTEYCLLDYFTVAPDFRGNGFGGKFFKMLVKYLSDYSPCKIMLLECEAKLVNWYEKNGALLSQVPPTQCDSKLFYLMEVSIHGDPLTCDYGHDLQALVEIRMDLHGLMTIEWSCVNIQEGQTLTCLKWNE